MCSNALKLKVLQNSAFKFFRCFELIPFRNGIQRFSIYKFDSNNNDKNDRNFRNVMYGIAGGSFGIAVVLGILNYSQNLRAKINSKCEKIKQRFTANGASIPQEEVGKSSSPRVIFNFLADVVEKTKKSVVYIEITARHPFTGKNIPISNGSGFIVKSDGLILTNAHVVNHFGHVIVKLYDGREFQAIVENVDTDSDLATVRIKAENLPELPLGQSSDLRPGEFVIAMGNPLTLSHTITAGVVSSVNRQGEELGLHKKSDYIQTDAAINVGNSGGPLVNLDGMAIGINTMKVTEGISFAIPSDRAIDFLKNTEGSKGSGNLFERTKQRKIKFLGATMLTLSSDVIKDLKEHNPDFPSVDHGVLIWRVMIGSPSYECGIRPGDVITEVNGRNVYKASIIEEHINKEDVVHLTVHRGQKTFNVSVTLVEPLMPLESNHNGLN